MRFLTAAALLACASAQAAEPPQVAFEVRVVEVREDFERVRPGVISARQFQALMEAIAGERSASVVQCPKVTVEDGKEAKVQITQRQVFVTGLDAARVDGKVTLVPRETPIDTGTTIAIRGKLSGKAVRVRVSYKDVRVGVETIGVVEGEHRLQVPQVETIAIEKRGLVIPVGGHAVLAGPAHEREVRQEYNTPVLSRVPYVNRLFKNVGIGTVTVRTLLIVSPKVITPDSVAAGS